MKEEKFHTLGSPFVGGDCGWWSRGASEPRRRVQQRVRRAKGRDSQRISANQHSPAGEACLLTRRDGWGLGAEGPASEVRSQGEDWGWQREHSRKGASAPQLDRKSTRLNSSH